MSQPPAPLWAGGFFVSHDTAEKGVSMNTMLYVDNLPESTTEDELRILFTLVGEVTTLKIPTDRASGKSKGYAFLTMSAESEADKAVSKFNTYMLSGRPLKVSFARSRARRSSTEIYFRH